MSVEGSVLSVLRALAAYAAAAALALWIADRCIARIRVRVALLLGAAPLLFTGPALLTGRIYAPIDVLYDAPPFGARRAELGIGPDRTPILADVAYQMLPWSAAVRRELLGGRAPLWNAHTLAGEPLLAAQQPGALHPAALLSLPLPLAEAVTFAMTVRILLALLAAYLYLREIDCGEQAALLGALAWAFCDWMSFYLGFPEQPAAAALPLLLLGLRRVVRGPRARSGAVVSASLLLAATAGHPETLLHVSAVGGAYFLFELVRSPSGRRGRAVLVAAACSAAAAGLAAVVLLPFLEALPRTFEHAFRREWYAHQPRTLPFEGLPGRLGRTAVPILGGASGHGSTEADAAIPSAYAGALAFPLAFVGLFATRRERWFFAAAGVVALAVHSRTPAADVLARLPLFDVAINERLVFVAAFSTCVLAALGADRLASGEGRAGFAAASGATLALVSILAVRNRAHWLELATPPPFVRERLLLEIVPLVLGAALVAALPRRARAGATVGGLAALLAFSRVLEAGRTYPALSGAALYPRFPILERIPRGEPYRIAGIGNALIPNTSAAYGLEDVRGYEAMTLRRLHDTFPLWCVPQPVWFNRVDDATRPFLSFLNVRWLLTELPVAAPRGWRPVAEGDGLRLFENPNPLPRAFAPRRIRREPDPALALDALRAIDDFGERGIVDESPRSDWEDNGRPSVAIVRYDRSDLEIEVNAPGEAVVGTSIPAWPGWRAELGPERRRVPLVVFDHAFVGLRVPAGQSRVRLRYAPESFTIGATVSLATLAAGVVLLLRR